MKAPDKLIVVLSLEAVVNSSSEYRIRVGRGVNAEVHYTVKCA